MCEESKLDTVYSLEDKLVNGKLSFYGYTNSRMYYDASIHAWKVELLSDPEVYGIRSVDYPLGDNYWKLNNVCEKAHIQALLHFSACNGDEYNCNSGSCIPMERLCDGRNDCEDMSDEVNCDGVTWGTMYLHANPPPPSKKNKRLLEINVSVDLFNVLKIDEVESTLAIQFGLKLEWFDVRLTFDSLKEQEDSNIFSGSKRLEIWIPQIVFSNTEDMQTTTLDDKAVLKASRQSSDYKLSPLSHHKNLHLYSGRDNSLKMQRVHSLDFICRFDMRFYPFDTQHCEMQMESIQSQQSFVTLVPKILKNHGPSDFIQYFIRDLDMKLVDNNNLNRTNYISVEVNY